MSGEVATAAVARWFAGHRRQESASYARTLARPACYEGEFVLPQVRRHTWFRTARLVQVRAEQEFGQAQPGRPAARELGDPAQEAARTWRMAFTTRAVRQMIATLGVVEVVTDKGVIKDVDHLLKGYASRWQVSERVAYRHWKAVRELGLVRQVRHSAYGQSARYVLTLPPAQLPDELPITAAGLRAADLDALVSSWDEAAGAYLALLDDAELVTYGSSATKTRQAVQENPEQTQPPRLSTYIRQAWPLHARVKIPSLSTDPRPRPAAGQRPGNRGGISDEERAEASRILNRCGSHWQRQLDHVPNDGDLAGLVGMVAVARRYTTEVELIELLTDRVASVRDLFGVLRYRLQQLLNRARRQAPADEDGSMGAARTAARAQVVRELHAETADSRAAARAALQAVRKKKAAAAAAAQQAEQARREAKRRELGLSEPAPFWPAPAEADEADPETRTELTAAELAELRWLQLNTRTDRGRERRREYMRKLRPLDLATDPHDVPTRYAHWSHPDQRR